MGATPGTTGDSLTMSAEPDHDWTERNPLARLALQRGRTFELMQLLHLVELTTRATAAIGTQGPVTREPVRLRPSLSLGFPPGDIAECTWIDTPDGGGRLRITATFLGLYGSDSPLPTHFTEQLLDEQEADERVREFIDLFHHRIYSLLYRVWRKYRYYATFRSDGRDPISQVVRGLLGLATDHLDENLRVSPLKLFRYVGLLSQRPRSAAGLRGQLADLFAGVAFRIEQCVDRWVWIQPSDRNALGLAKCTLGRDCLVGERMVDRSGKFRICIGPVGFDDYVRFLPDGSATRELTQIVRFYCDDPLLFDIRVTLRGDEVPDTPLGGEAPLGRLACTSWVKSRPCEDKSVVFNIAGQTSPDTRPQADPGQAASASPRP